MAKIKLQMEQFVHVHQVILAIKMVFVLWFQDAQQMRFYLEINVFVWVAMWEERMEFAQKQSDAVQMKFYQETNVYVHKDTLEI